MTNWDDYRVFLAVARHGSISKAASALGVNRSTVLRRITAFEETLGVRLFERLPSGYFTTAAGEQILSSANQIEEVSTNVSRQIAGQDRKLSGSILVTLPGVLAAYVLMPDLTLFASQNPEIKLEILNTYNVLDLSKREADVAIRIANDPPENLVGRRVVKVVKTAYMAKKHLNSPEQRADFWLGWSLDQAAGQWLADSPYPDLPVGAIITDPFVTVKALETGMGMAVLPCFMGEQHAGLCHVPKPGTFEVADLWVLTHKDLRNTARIRKFTDFISKALTRHRDLLEGSGAKSG